MTILLKGGVRVRNSCPHALSVPFHSNGKDLVNSEIIQNSSTGNLLLDKFSAAETYCAQFFYSGGVVSSRMRERNDTDAHWTLSQRRVVGAGRVASIGEAFLCNLSQCLGRGDRCVCRSVVRNRSRKHVDRGHEGRLLFRRGATHICADLRCSRCFGHHSEMESPLSIGSKVAPNQRLSQPVPAGLAKSS